MNDKCCVCGKFISEEKGWFCESCGGLHHPDCSGEDGGESCTEDCGEDTTYSYCQKCIDGKVQE